VGLHVGARCIYANPDATEDDYMRAANRNRISPSTTATRRIAAGELLLGPAYDRKHNGPMSEVARAGAAVLWCRRVRQPDILLLDEPTNNLDINTIRWLRTSSTCARAP